MAAHLLRTRLRTRLPRSSSLSGITGAYERARAPSVGHCLEAVGASQAGYRSPPFSHSHEVMGSSLRSSGGARLQHSSALFRFANSNLSNAAREASARVTGIPGGIHTVRNQHTDEWLVQRALADRKRRQARSRARLIPIVDNDNDDFVPHVDPERNYILPVSAEEEKIAGVLGRPDLIITRNVEWANLAFGFEQQNKYVIMDPREPQAPVGYILEDSNVLMRQFLRRRRPFVASVLDAYGNEICRVRRPIWFINSTIYVEVDGKVIGEAHRRWHLWKRIYDCYLGGKQFAAVENPGFWYWTFTLQDEDQDVLAVIDRNWRGFGFEFLTDAGQYVVRFGDSVPSYVPSVLRPQPVLSDVRKSGGPILSGSSTGFHEMQNLQAAAQEAEDLVVKRPLSLSERAVTLALAVSLDNDYFSNHSAGFGFVPLPFFGGGSEVADDVASTENGSPVVGCSDSAQDVASREDVSSEPLEHFYSEESFPGGSPTEAADDVAWTQDMTAESSENLYPEEPDSPSQDDADVFVDPFDMGIGDWGKHDW